MRKLQKNIKLGERESPKGREQGPIEVGKTQQHRISETRRDLVIPWRGKKEKGELRWKGTDCNKEGGQSML